MTTNIKILTIKEIQSTYKGLSRDEIYSLLNTKGCPVLPRKRNAPYKIVQSEWEKWLCSQRK